MIAHYGKERCVSGLRKTLYKLVNDWLTDLLSMQCMQLFHITDVDVVFCDAAPSGAGILFLKFEKGIKPNSRQKSKTTLAKIVYSIFSANFSKKLKKFSKINVQITSRSIAFLLSYLFQTFSSPMCMSAGSQSAI